MKTPECKSRHEIAFSCSCSLKVIYIVVFAILAGAIVASSASLQIKVIAAFMGIIGFFLAFRQILWLEKLDALVLSSDGLFYLEKNNDGAEPKALALVGGVFVSPLVATFKCVPVDRASSGAVPAFGLLKKLFAISVVVFKDFVSERDHQLLRVYLNTGQIPTAEV